ncbi:MAG: M28 family peptidase [Gemmatimonadaceae bacterium]|nr:M28 family peptidase [Gemmatimonadaceae bacterium]
MRAFLSAVAATAIAVGTVHAQQLPVKRQAKPTRPAITAEDLMSRLYVYADDSLGGRAAGTPQHDKATEIIAGWAKQIGLKPMGDSGTFFQSVPLLRRAWVTAPVVVGDRTFEYQRDYAVFAQWGIKPFDGADVVFGGLIGDTAVKLTADQTKGKVVVFGFTPEMAAKGLQVQFTAALTRPVAGAAAVVLPMLDDAPSAIRGYFMQREMVTPPPAGPTMMMPPAIIASNAMTEALVGAPLTAAKWGTVTGRYTGKVELKDTPAAGRNVVAMLEGSDPVLRHQYVAIGAHSDHVGTRPSSVDHDSLRAFNIEVERLKAANGGKDLTPAARAAIKVNVDSIRVIRRARPDSISNGADDDGSGTVAVAEVAEALAADKVKPRRSVLFVWHMGEEIGLVGSDYFTRNPTVPRDSIVAQLNMDMVGRGSADDLPGGGPTYLQLVGTRRLSTQLGDLIETVNTMRKTPFKFDYTFDAPGHPENIYCRSDHWSYARYGIPVAFFTTGLHADYHQVTDEPQYIDYPHMASVTQFVHDIALSLANNDKRPVVDKPKPTSPNAPCRQ